MGLPVTTLDRSWKYPIVAGLGSIPFTLFLQWLSAGNLVLVPVLFTGLVVGYLFTEQRISSRRAGWRAGLVGGLALLWGGFQFLALIPEYQFTIAGSALAGFSTALVVCLYIVIYGVIGGIGGAIGEWLANRIDGYRSVPIANRM